MFYWFYNGRIPKVTLLLFRVRCETLNTNQFRECECVMGFPFIHFNVPLLGLSGYTVTSWHLSKIFRSIASEFLLACMLKLRNIFSVLSQLLDWSVVPTKQLE